MHHLRRNGAQAGNATECHGWHSAARRHCRFLGMPCARGQAWEKSLSLLNQAQREGKRFMLGSCLPFLNCTQPEDGRCGAQRLPPLGNNCGLLEGLPVAAAMAKRKLASVARNSKPLKPHVSRCSNPTIPHKLKTTYVFGIPGIQYCAPRPTLQAVQWNSAISLLSRSDKWSEDGPGQVYFCCKR